MLKFGGVDLLYYHGLKTVEKGFNKKYCVINIQNTIIKDLTTNENELFDTLGKHLKSYIKRNMKENVMFEFFDSNALKQEPLILNQVAELFEKMYYDKGMDALFNFTLAQEYIKANGLCIGIARIDGNIVGFDAVIHDEKSARLWLTAFDFRNDNNDKQILSRSHQNLDWQMLIWCKNHGIEKFDFGGINSFDNPNGIAKFKMAFNGEPVTYYNVIVPKSLVGYMAVIFMKLKKIFRR